MLDCLPRCLSITGRALVHAVPCWLHAVTKPAPAPRVTGALADLQCSSKPELIAANAVLRQQLRMRQRSVNRPRCTADERALLVLRTSHLSARRQGVLIAQAETILRWHRELVRHVWHRKVQPKAPAHRPPLAPESVALIRQMAAANRLWGAERIRGEVLKLTIPVANWTISPCA